MLCIIGPALLILLVTLAEFGFLRGVISEDTAGIIGVIVLLLLVALAVALFIFSDTRLERYKYLQKGFNLPYFCGPRSSSAAVHLPLPIRCL